MGWICPSTAHAAPLAPPPEPPAAEGHGGGADLDDNDDNDTFTPLLDLLERFPDLFAQEVLRHLDPVDRTFLARAGGACRAAVAASDLPRAGTREEVLGRSVCVGGAAPARGVCLVRRAAGVGHPTASGCPWVAHTCVLIARGGRLDVLRWAREHGCAWDEMTWAPAGVAVGAGA